MSLVVLVDGEPTPFLAADTGFDVQRRLGLAKGKWINFANAPLEKRRTLQAQGVHDDAIFKVYNVTVVEPVVEVVDPIPELPEQSECCSNDTCSWSILASTLACGLIILIPSGHYLEVTATCDVPQCTQAANATLDCCLTTVYNTTCADHTWVLSITSCVDEWSRVNDACAWMCRYHDGATTASGSISERAIEDGDYIDLALSGTILGSILTFAAVTWIVCVASKWKHGRYSTLDRLCPPPS